MLKNVFIHQIMMKEEKTLLEGKNKKIIGLMKDEKAGKVITKFATMHQKHLTIKYKTMTMK